MKYMHYIQLILRENTITYSGVVVGVRKRMATTKISVYAKKKI